MKNSAIVVLLLAFSFSACQNKKPLSEGIYEVTGKIDGLPEDMRLVVSDISTKDIVPLYEVKVKRNDKFKLGGDLTEPTPFYLTLLRESDSTFSPSDNLVVFFEPNRIEIQAEAGKLSEATVSGSQAHNHFEIYRKDTKGYEDKIKQLSQQIQTLSPNDSSKYDDLSAQYEQQYEAWKIYNKKFLAEDSLSHVVRSFLALNYMLEEDYVSDLKQLVKGKSTTWTNQIDSYINQVEEVSVGAVSPDLDGLIDKNGESSSLKTTLSDKPSIVYFWSSFEPEALSATSRLSLLDEKVTENYQMVGISLDVDNNAWLEAIDNLPSSHAQFLDVSEDRKSALVYHITQLPLFVVLDENQRIVHKTDSPEKLQAYIDKNCCN